MRLPLALLLAPLVFGTHAQADPPPTADQAKTALAALSPDTTAAVLLTDGQGAILFAHHPDRPMPTASAIKPAILAALFDRFESSLTTSPPELQRILDDPRHPALAHYSRQYRREVRDTLGGASILRLGHIMIDAADETGARVSNPVYNAAANLAMALLGGPRATSEHIRALNPVFADIQVRRYMLAPRDKGDNTATPAALAALHRHIASAGGHTHQKIRKILFSKEKSGTKLYSKDGALTTDPVAHVRAGWTEAGSRRRIHVIMASQPRDARKAREQLVALKKSTKALALALVGPI